MEQIGRGGMAVVYRAIDVRLDRAVALKLLAPELARDEAFRLRFIRECRAAAAVDHPYIIPVFDAGEASGILFIAMRYVSGRDVRRLLDREQTLPAWRAVNIIEQVASALDAAHERGLVHRDVKPANMLLDAATGSGQLDHVYLSDFGLTKQALSTSSLTSTGQFLGTLDYIAPEQIENRNVDGRADLYSLACAAYEMLAGSPPFRRDQGVAVIWAQVSAPVPQLTDRRPDLPVAVDAVLTKALAKTPENRYDTCQQFASALRRACGLSSESVIRRGGGPAGPPTDLAGWMADPGAADRGGAGPGGAGGAAVPGGAAGLAGAAGIAAAGGTKSPAGYGGYDAAGGPGYAGGGTAAGSGYAGGGAAGSGYAGRDAVGGSAGYPAGSGYAGRDAAAGSGYAGRDAAGDSADYGGGFRSASSYRQQGGAGFPPQPPTTSAEPIRPTKADRRPSGYGPSSYPPPGHPGQRSAAQRSPSQYPPGQRPTGGRPPRGRPWWRSPAAVIIGCLVVVGLAGGAVAVLHGRTGPSGHPLSNSSPAGGGKSSGAAGTPAGSASPATPVISGPSGTVTAYFAALNAQNYPRAWNLGGRNSGSTYTSYVNGYDTTSKSTVDILSASGNIVTARVTALQTDGTVKTFQGTYTVTDGVITSFNVHQIS
jgi:Protein kinase domain